MTSVLPYLSLSYKHPRRTSPTLLFHTHTQSLISSTKAKCTYALRNLCSERSSIVTPRTDPLSPIVFLTLSIYIAYNAKSKPPEPVKTPPDSDDETEEEEHPATEETDEHHHHNESEDQSEEAEEKPPARSSRQKDITSLSSSLKATAGSASKKAKSSASSFYIS